MTWFPFSLSIVMGTAIAGVWLMLLARGQVAELRERPRAIRFHLLAELGTAALLFMGALGLWLATDWAVPLAAAALGAALYTTINSSGFYADRGEWPPVVMFQLLAALTIGALAVLIIGV